MRLLLYCTKAKNKYDRLVRDEHYGKPFYLYGAITENFESLNGKIVAECDFEVEEIKKKCVDVFKYCYSTDTLNEFELMNKTQLDGNTTNNYLKGKNGYAIHIKNLHIFDKPKYLDELWAFDKQGLPYKITNAPQNMMKVNLPTFMNDDNYVLISIHSEWLFQILNGKKTIEVRKKVLKEMLE